MKSSLTTLCYIEKNDSYLMLHRVSKKNDVNKDKWIGVGGHFENRESPEECLLREVYEETGLRLTSYRYRGIVTFVFEDEPAEYMSLYTADGFEGSVTNPDGSMKECNEAFLHGLRRKLSECSTCGRATGYFFVCLMRMSRSFHLSWYIRGMIL